MSWAIPLFKIWGSEGTAWKEKHGFLSTDRRIESSECDFSGLQ